MGARAQRSPDIQDRVLIIGTQRPVVNGLRSCRIKAEAQRACALTAPRPSVPVRYAKSRRWAARSAPISPERSSAACSAGDLGSAAARRSRFSVTTSSGARLTKSAFASFCASLPGIGGQLVAFLRQPRSFRAMSIRPASGRTMVVSSSTAWADPSGHSPSSSGHLGGAGQAADGVDPAIDPLQGLGRGALQQHRRWL